jgi:LmbE family N-acetylglucosaminyl deacetylase
VLAPHPEDAHPDHREGGRLLERALYFAHVGGFPAEGRAPPRARPAMHDWPEAARALLGFAPGFGGSGLVIDVSGSFAQKRAALECYATQFVERAGEATRLNRPTFLASVEARARAGASSWAPTTARR